MAVDVERDQHEEFPWHLGVFDAHCHPTDTLSSIDSIPSMKTRVLTVMSTRAEDQELVAQTADRIGTVNSHASITDTGTRVLPCFGWHPWFSHQMFLDDAFGNRQSLSDEEKIRHYRNALSPQPKDENFLLALPNPRPFSTFIDQTREFLRRYPLALVGEIGLDKSFRIPEAWLPEHREQRDRSLNAWWPRRQGAVPFPSDHGASEECDWRSAEARR